MGDAIDLVTPFSVQDVEALRSGDRVTITGLVYTARDAAHRRLLELIHSGEDLPIPLEGQVIYYVGPSPPPPGRIIGAAGPTTSYRMDPYTPTLLEKGIRGDDRQGQTVQRSH